MGRLTNLKPAVTTLGSPVSYMRDREGHSTEAEPWRRWYKLARWQAIRRSQLTRHPLCQMCEPQGVVTSATVCDHVEPHRGDPHRFWSGPFQSLCKPHHDRDKQALERRSGNKAW
jgi:5-methylcytosine-specific restriction protein A